jgi:hypothetical protein
VENELRQKFEQARKAALPIDVRRRVMEKIQAPRRQLRHLVLIPALLGLALVLWLALPGAEAPKLDPAPESFQVVVEYRSRFPPYLSPYGNLEILRIKKGSESL